MVENQSGQTVIFSSPGAIPAIKEIMRDKTLIMVIRMMMISCPGEDVFKFIYVIYDFGLGVKDI